MEKQERLRLTREGKHIFRSICDKTGKWFINYHTENGGWRRCSLSFKTKEECDSVLEARCNENPSQNIKDE